MVTTLKLFGLQFSVLMGYGELFHKDWQFLSYSKYHLTIHPRPRGPALMITRKGF